MGAVKAAREDYFEIRVRATSEIERKMCVKDLEKRGFEVARYFEYEVEGSTTVSTRYKSAAGIEKRMRFGEVYKYYGAVMRRPSKSAE